MARSFEESLLYLLHLILAMWQRELRRKRSRSRSEGGRSYIGRQRRAVLVSGTR
jgi:hypothetical protein